MGRSVSTPHNAALVAFVDWFDGTYTDEETGEEIQRQPESYDWDDYMDCTRDHAKSLWPSFEDTDRWLGREDRVLLENRLAYFGVSEYCGLAAIWIVPKDHGGYPELANSWVSQISTKFHANFGELRKVGTASNGEAFFERIKR
jgi:hypothetical protein